MINSFMFRRVDLHHPHHIDHGARCSQNLSKQQKSTKTYTPTHIQNTHTGYSEVIITIIRNYIIMKKQANKKYSIDRGQKTGTCKNSG